MKTVISEVDVGESWVEECEGYKFKTVTCLKVASHIRFFWLAIQKLESIQLDPPKLRNALDRKNI